MCGTLLSLCQSFLRLRTRAQSLSQVRPFIRASGRESVTGSNGGLGFVSLVVWFNICLYSLFICMCISCRVLGFDSRIALLWIES